MAYATVADFKARVDQRIVDQLASQSGQGADDAVIQQALDDGANVVDGYLAAVASEHRPAAGVLQPYAVDIALYRLALRRPGQSFESIKAGHDEAIKFLTRVAEGKLTGAGRESGGGGAGSIAFGGPDPVMTRDTLEDL